MRLHSLALTLALASVAGVMPAIASDDLTVTVTSTLNARHTQKVDYGDLDISNVRGAKILVKRIRAAANEVCETPMGNELSGVQKHLDCVRDTVKATIASLNNPVVTAVYTGKQPSPVT